MMKVGELAKYAGVTVRALHHYDAIGLLAPSGRSDAGYRLYNEADVARLHAIQALRDANMPLDEIAQVLDGASGAEGVAVIDQHIGALEREIRQAQELRQQLVLMRDKLLEDARGHKRETLLEALSLMSIYRQHFTAAELQKIGTGWAQVESEWPPLIEALARAMAEGVPPDAPALAPLTRQWLALMNRWMAGDADLIHRWGEMYERGKGPVSSQGPSREMSRYVVQAFDAQLAMLRKHFSEEEIAFLGRADTAALSALGREVERLAQAGVEPSSPAALELLRRFGRLTHEFTGGNLDFQRRLAQARLSEPLFAAVAPTGPVALEFMQRVALAHGEGGSPEDRARFGSARGFKSAA